MANLAKSCGFVVPDDEMVFVGLRGCVPVGSATQDMAGSHTLEYLGVDYRHLRCSIVQWNPKKKSFALFPGSTVPHETAVRTAMARGGVGTNQLTVGFYRGKHRYYRGDHKLNAPNSRHRAFRNDSVLPVLRTSDDADYDGADALDIATAPGDNIHCAWQQNPAADSFSSNGCQVIVGRPKVAARGWSSELGPWALFVERAYALQQTRFCYALFSGREVLAAAATDTPRPPSVRFGSEGGLVELVQDALIKHGYDLGSAGADGDFGLATVAAVGLFQRQQFGAGGVDLIVGANTAQALGLAWPKALDDDLPPELPPVSAPAGPVNQPLVTPASSGPGTQEARPDYRSLTPDGIFSSTPFDLSQRRSLRTNNPGALNVSAWQRAFPGFVGETQPDFAGNRTSIYVTPEHGIAAWHHLMTNRYGFGAKGKFMLAELARRYAGVPSADGPAVKAYLKGWAHHAPNLSGDRELSLDLDADMLLLAKGMFGHEFGGKSPWKDDQVLTALELVRTGKLPPK
ncbi:peptidoglycan-binding domain-containing protein [Sphingobium yanoikuyae]|uniref:peptidoglycan-binding domain-containing protein n=1 Tax=Sphingobium yanoikuyae TaxID=13690 RepID=UPI0028AEAD90|nr:peptidoglycan-binding domain-containing protein [Sphingobium yanoikuyae]